MAAVAVEIGPRPAEADLDPATEEIQFIGDMDVVVESLKCSCNSGDDNPY